MPRRTGGGRFLGKDLIGWWPATLAILGWLAWEIADWWATEKLKAEKEAQEKARQEEAAAVEALRRTMVFRGRLLFALSGIVNARTERILRALAATPNKVPIQIARAALAATGQIGVILEQLAFFLHQSLPAARAAERQNFRVCLFIAAGEGLVPLDGFDLASRRHRLFPSFDQHERHYRLDNTTDPAHAVLCIRERRLLIVPDCAADPSFQRFKEGQETYLKSLAAYPIVEGGDRRRDPRRPGGRYGRGRPFSGRGSPRTPTPPPRIRCPPAA